MTICVNNGVSIAIAGATAAAKTADKATSYSWLPKKRIVTIEDTRELSLAKLRRNGIMTNDVIHLLYKRSAESRHHAGLIKAVR